MAENFDKLYPPGAIGRWLAKASRRQLDRPAAVLLLLPGLSSANVRRLLRCSAATVLNWRRRAATWAAVDSSLEAEVRRLTREITTSDGVWLARNRGNGHLSFWSRLAIKAMRAEGLNYEQLSVIFAIHSQTVRNVCSGQHNSGFYPLSGVRRRTDYQCAPSGRWQKIS
jgi:hypothetical protein